MEHEHYENRSRIIDRDILKYLAVIPMVTGHFCSYLSGDALYKDMPFIVFALMYTAIFAPPIFFFMISEGFKHTRSRKKYALRLLIFTVINQIPFCLVNNGTLLTTEFFQLWNIFLTLFLGLAALMIWECSARLPIRIGLIVLLDILTVVTLSEWMIFGIPIILCFHIFRNDPKKRFIAFSSLTLLHTLVTSILNFTGWFYTISAALINSGSMLLAYYLISKHYNGNKGKHPVFSKWFFYILYPVHLWIIYLIKYF